ncbi:MAG: hypothetical protein ACRDSK_18280 [Actinophytocola sp.]|uniref:hypothetical protein n=1 Tax=Actinophytocola sp. TaxID=1872138 RepID=UPI003D6BAB49
MNVTPELVRAEMDYRIEQALEGAALEQVREARQARRRIRRLRGTAGTHGDTGPRPAINGAPRAA